MKKSILKLALSVGTALTLCVIAVGWSPHANAASPTAEQGLCQIFGCQGGDVRCVDGTVRYPDGTVIEFECGGPEA